DERLEPPGGLMRSTIHAVVVGLATSIAGLNPLAAQSSPLTPADIFQIQFAADAQISPDGQWIVYVRQWADQMTDRRYSNIWIVKTDGSEHRPLTTGKYNEDTPRWSPDGKRLAYISNRGGSSQIYVRWIDDGTTVTATNVTTPPSAVAWSPDGSQL